MTGRINPAPGQPSLRLRVSASAESALRAGHPWVFGESIRKQNRDGISGELAIVYDRNDKFLAAGLFDPESPIRFRLLHHGKRERIDDPWWAAHFSKAINRRAGLFGPDTTGYRLINGESDGWPGLVLDRYGGAFVLKLYTSAWLSRLGAIMAAIQSQLSPERVILRLSRNARQSAENHFGRNDGEVLFGPPIESPIVFLESGLRFEADVLRGQKTGFFLDQRENRRRAGQLARGRTVLNAFSFSGGFSLYAARGGAKAVIDVDISPHALQAAKRNFALNQISAVKSCRYEQVQGDAFEWLRARRNFDMIILDPPSLAKRESERAGAIRAYGKLAALAIATLEADGILLACSCSAHVTAEEFFGSVRAAAARSRRSFEEIATTRHPPDHPATFKEANYLKAIYLRF